MPPVSSLSPPSVLPSGIQGDDRGLIIPLRGFHRYLLVDFQRFFLLHRLFSVRVPSGHVQALLS